MGPNIEASGSYRPKGVIANSFFQIKFFYNRFSSLLESPSMICVCHRTILVSLDIALSDNLGVATTVRFHYCNELLNRHRTGISTNRINLIYHSRKL